MSSAAAPTTDVGDGGAFGPAMGIVAAVLGVMTLGAYVGRGLGAGASLVFLFLALLCFVGLRFARDAGGMSVGLLFVAGLFLGLGLAGTLDAYASADPGVVWQATAATALFVAALGSIGFAISTDLSAGYRVLFVLLLALIVYGFVSLFTAMPGSNVIYALLGLGIFGGYTVLDFNRLRGSGADDAVSIGAGIFLDIVNVFLFFLQIFDRRGD